MRSAGCCGGASGTYLITNEILVDCAQGVCGECIGVIPATRTVSSGATEVFLTNPGGGCKLFQVLLDGDPFPFTGNSVVLPDIDDDHVLQYCFSGVSAPNGSVISTQCSPTVCGKRANTVSDGNCGTSVVLVDDATCTSFSACCGELGYQPCCGQVGYPACPFPCDIPLVYNQTTGLCSAGCPPNTAPDTLRMCVPCGGLNQIPCDNECPEAPCINGCAKGFTLSGGICVKCGGAGQPACSGGNCDVTPCTQGCNNGLSNFNGICQSCPSIGSVVTCSCNGNCNQANVILADGNCNTLPAQVVTTPYVGCPSCAGFCTCGALNQPPCPTTCNAPPCNGGCNDGLISNGSICVPCGGNGQLPCTNCGALPCINGCDSGQLLSNGRCCPSGTAWNGSSCTTCGGLNQIPCTSGTPCSGGLISNGSLCVTACGNGSYWNGSNCVACGGVNQLPCPNGTICTTGTCVNGCNSDLIFNGSVCVAPCPTNGTEIGRVCNGQCNEATVTYADGVCGTYTQTVPDTNCTNGCGGGGGGGCPSSYQFCGTCAANAANIVAFAPTCTVLSATDTSYTWVSPQDDNRQSVCTGSVLPLGTTEFYCDVVWNP